MRPQKRAFSTSLAASWAVSTLAAEVLADWPHGFSKFLAHLEERSTVARESGSLQEVFGGFYRALYMGLRSPSFDFVRASFEDYVAQHWTGALAKRNRRIGSTALGQSKWEPISRARARLGVSLARMRQLLAEGQLRSAQRLLPSGRCYVVVHRDDVHAKAREIHGDRTLAQAAAELGLKRSRLAVLLPLICPHATQALEGRGRWAVPNAWLGAWKSRLEALPIVRGAAGAKTFGRLLRFDAWPVERVARLLNGVASGEVPVIGRVRQVTGLPAMVFDCDVLAGWNLSGTHDCNALTVPQTAAAIGVKQEVAYLLIRRGLLDATRRRCGTRTSAWISVAQLDRFMRTYVWCRDIAARLKTSPKAVAAMLEQKGVRQASGPVVDQGRQVLYRRCDLVGVLPGLCIRSEHEHSAIQD